MDWTPQEKEGPVGLALLVFITVFLGIAGGYPLVSELLFPEVGRRRRRLAEEFSRENGPLSTSPLYKNPDRLHIETGPVLVDFQPEVADLGIPRRDLRGRLVFLLEQANLPWNPEQLGLIAAGLSLLLGLNGVLLGGLYLGLLGAAGGALLPIIFVQTKRRIRREKYLKQLPQAFDLMARVIRAGQSVPQSLQAVADAFENPLAGEFANCQKQQNLGLRPEVTFQEMAVRSGILEMRIFAMAMLIQRQTGGNLSEVLERLAGLVRARLKLKRHVRTLTAEGRLQGWTLVILPFLALAIMMAVNRQYVEVLFDHVYLLAGMVAAMGIGILWIRKIIQIEG